jgi:mannan endo-1,4-beta-mannosidase
MNTEHAGPSRRSVLTRTVAGTIAGAAGLSIGLADAAPALAAAPAGPGEFVTAAHGGFRVGGRPFRFGGTNTYYLHQQSHYMIDMALDDASAMGLRVVRAWAFADGAGGSYTALQPAPYVYDNAAFDSLDYAVYKAGQLGIRLVLALVNNWPDYGGMAQYVKWSWAFPTTLTGRPSIMTSSTAPPPFRTVTGPT